MQVAYLYACAKLITWPGHMTRRMRNKLHTIILYTTIMHHDTPPYRFVGEDRSRMSIEEKRICEGVSDRLLDSRVNDLHVAEIAHDLVDWESLAPYLGITESEEMEIKAEFVGRYNLQKRQALRTWRMKNGEKATYRNLISICCSQGLLLLAEKSSQYAASSRKRPRSSELVDSTFYNYLLDCYRDLLHPSREQWPSKEVTHIIPSTFFDLILYEAPLSEVDRSSSETLKSVTLSSILKKDKEDRLLVYFEGIAGSGKTTLSWHMSREWAHKRLLEQFQILIYLQLNDPQIQSATHFSDIIPYPDKILQQQIASEILDRQGQSVCFLLEGLDEAPTSLLDLLVGELIIGRPGGWQLPRASFIMTSRPDEYVTSKLKSFLSSRHIIEGFSGNNLNQFLDESLGTTSEKEMLLSKFELNPRLQGLCCHPINAVIMCFLTLFMKEDLPTTQTNLYKPLVCNYLIRHMDTRITENQSHDIMIDNLTDDSCIPPQIREPFRIVCRLAYSSVLKNKRLFTAKELGEAQVDNVLGFLKVHPKITMYGSERYYSFFHLSLQEFLAAVCLSKMSENAQVKTMEKILNRNPLSQVLHFYAGLTSLSNNQALKLLSQYLREAADYLTIMTQFHPHDPRPRLSAKALTFLNCLYESQNEAIMNLPETYLLYNENVREAARELQRQTKAVVESESLGTLTLIDLPLTPIDCLSIGYYIRIKSLARVPSFPCQHMYYLGRCSIDHIGIRVLFTEMKKNISQHTPCSVGLDISGNILHRESLFMLKDLLQGQPNLNSLMLCRCFLSEDLHCALKYITEGVSNNSSCRYFDLSGNQISTSHIHHLVLMLRTSPQLYNLELRCQDLRRGLYLLWKALQLLPNLQCLDMSRCNIHDPELALLQEVVKSHPKLCVLSIYDNCFTHNGLCNLLKVFVGNRISVLNYLGLGIQCIKTEERILEEINLFRTSIRHPHLILKSYRDTTMFEGYNDIEYCVI